LLQLMNAVFPLYLILGDSSIGMNVSFSLEGSQLILDPSIDVNETAAIAYSARESGMPG